VKIFDVSPERMRAIAEILVDAFRDTGSPAWPTIEDATAEVMESLEPGRISRIAIDAGDAAVGWIGGIPEYEGSVWELHPLVVRRDRQRHGVGRLLVADFENEVAKRGGHTILVGTDDENCRTTLGGVDLYPDVLEKLRAIENRASHPFEFYRKLGYEVVGVIPDANGFGKPDILMAKRIG